MLFKPEFGSQSQVGALRTNSAISPLSLRERARVRAAIARQAQIPTPHRKSFLTASHFNRLESLARRLHGQFVPVFTLLEYCL
jgi:hypothetical protein